MGHPMTKKMRRRSFLKQSALATAGGALAHAALLVLVAALVVGLSQLGIAPALAAVIVAAIQCFFDACHSCRQHRGVGEVRVGVCSGKTIFDPE